MSKLVLVALLFALVGSIACQDCYTTIVKYYKCKWFYPFLTPIKNGPYEQIPMLNYDLITEQFIATQNLTTRFPNFTASMSFFQSIFKEMKKNKCFTTKFLDVSPGTYSPIFFTKGYYDDVVQIIRDFKTKFAPDLLSRPEDQVLARWDDWKNKPTITNFCLMNDFTSRIYGFYNTTGTDCGLTDDEFTEYFFACMYPASITNGKVLSAPNPKLLVQTAQCSVLAASSCDRAVKRFWMFTDWTDFFPKMKVPAGKNKTIKFFDDLSDKAKLPDKFLNFSYMYADWSATSLSLRGYNVTQKGGGLTGCGNGSSGHTDVILNTEHLLLEGTWKPNAKLGCSLTNVTLTTIFEPKKDKKSFSFNITNPTFKDKFVFCFFFNFINF